MKTWQALDNSHLTRSGWDNDNIPSDWGKRTMYKWRHIMTKLYKGTLVLYNSQQCFTFRVLFRLLHDTDWLLELWHWEVSAWSRFLNRKRGVREIEREETTLRSLKRTVTGTGAWRSRNGDTGPWRDSQDDFHTQRLSDTLSLTTVLSWNLFSSRWNSYNTQSSSSLQSDKIYTDNMPVLGSKNVPVDKVSSSFSPSTFSL